MAKIHPTAQVDPRAKLAEDVEIGPFCVVGPEVEVGPGTRLFSHVVLEGRVRLGARNQIYPFVTIGMPPQHLAYQGEPTRVEIGDENILREYVSVHRGTTFDQGVTRIGNRCFLMAYVHVAHDCDLADEVIMASGAMLAGHVRVGPRVFFGGQAGVHQFVRIGEHAFIGAHSGVNKDVPPFVKVFGNPAGIYDLNLVGLRRAGFSREVLKALREALRIYLEAPTVAEALALLREKGASLPQIETFRTFLEAESRQGLMRRQVRKGEGF